VPVQDRSRAQLVRTTARLLRRQGYAATGLKQILAESGVTTGSLYHHFPGGKEELAAAALRHSGEAVRAALGAAFDGAGDPGDAVAAWARGAAAALRRDPADGCPIAPSAWESVHGGERLRAAASAALQSWQEEITSRLTRRGWSPESAREAAIAVLALLEGGLLLARTSGDGALLESAGAAARELLRRPDGAADG
jgi:TetR/AcrR family transcriptional repressor of lmrAB and yxaGH operons